MNEYTGSKPEKVNKSHPLGYFTTMKMSKKHLPEILPQSGAVTEPGEPWDAQVFEERKEPL